MRPMLLPSPTSWLLAFALVAVPAVASAQALPKGYASDESPTAPAATTPVSTPAAAPTMKPTAGDDANATATAQISLSTDEYADTDPSALTDFQEPLQPYGSWASDDTYGTVWVPDSDIVGADFAPYQSGGYWSTTDDGEWLWVSTYDWGYIPFHYGRWVWIASRGWSWIPGRTYASSWVVWRTSDYGYIGWAPMPPTYYWYGGSVAYFTTVPAAAYVFCPTSYVYHTNVQTYVVHDKGTVTKIAAHSRNYKPANPTASGAGSKAPDSAKASKSSNAIANRATALHSPIGPSAKEAGIPDSAVPKSRSAADKRAQMFSRKSTTAKAKALVKSQRAASVTAAGSSPASRTGGTLRGGGAVSAASRGSAPTAAATRGGSIPAAAATRGGSAPGVTRGGSAPGATRGGSVGSWSGAATQPSQSRGHAPVIRTPSSRGSNAAPSAPSRASQPQPQRASAPANVSRPAARATAPAAKSTPRASAPASRPSAPAAAPRAAAPAAPRASGGGHRR